MQVLGKNAEKMGKRGAKNAKMTKNDTKKTQNVLIFARNFSIPACLIDLGQAPNQSK